MEQEVPNRELLGDEREGFMEDRISNLPQELVVSILSRLTIREAVTTSVLSHRWEKLWTFFNGSLSLNFDAIFPVDLLEEMQLLEQERHKYVSRVNQVLNSLDESSIPLEFSVCFDLDKDYSGHIDRWIEFVMEKKRVPRVQFDFTPFLSALGDRNMRYTFPHDCYVRLKQPGGLYSISSLTSLCLKFVNVSGELIEHFLSNCPLLERLCVGGSEQLLNLKVIGATLQLKYLEILQCYSLECVKISAPNLVSFNYFGRKKIELHFENVPQLVEVSLGSGYGGGGSIAYLMYFLSSYHSQLETLKLFIDTEVEKEFPQFLQFNKLKHLTLSVYASSEDSLLEWTSLIKASPVLHKLTLELMTANRSRGWMMRDVTDCPHPCLKVVEVVGFIGYATDIELIMYFSANAIMLEKIIIDARHPSDFGTPREFRLSEKKREAKARALSMRGNLPPGVDVVIV